MNQPDKYKTAAIAKACRGGRPCPPRLSSLICGATTEGRPYRLSRLGLFLFIALLSSSSLANDFTEFLGRRVTSVEVVIDGAPGSNTTEIKALLEVAAGQDFSPVRIHDSLVRLHHSGLISGARVEATASGSDGVALRFVVKPQARIENVVFEGTTVFPANELRARLNELDPGERLSQGAIERGLAEILGFYSARGYYQARVTSRVELDPTSTRATVIYAVEPREQARVSAFTIDVKGERIDLSKVKHSIVEGKPFTQADVQEEMDQIRQAHVAQDFLAVKVNNKITADVINNTVAVTVTVESGPRVMVEVEGIKLSEKQMREILPFYTQGGIDDFALEEGRRRLLDLAQRQGYFFAEVTRPTAPPPDAATVRLKYIVETGQRYKLTDIDIEGITAIPSKELQDQLKSKRATIIPFFGLNRGKTSNDLLRQDANLIQKRLRELGYRRALVDVLRGISVTGEALIITFKVEQGPRTYIETIDIRGNNVLTTDELSPRLELKPGDPFVTTDVTQNADQLLTAYTIQGYANAEVVSELAELGTVGGQDRVRLVYAVTEGNRVRIRNITVRGAAVTNTGRLERDFFMFKEGEWLRQDHLQETERVLYDTNSFNSVVISSEPSGRTTNRVEERDVTVNVAEAKRNLLIYGFGYQSNQSDLVVPGLGFLNGARGLVQITNTNLFGKLYTGSTQFRASQNELLGQVSFQNPRPFGTNYPTLISIFARRLAEKTFRSDRYTALIQAERRISDETIAYVTYNFERISIYNLRGSLEDIERNRRPIRLGRIGPSFARDTRDNGFEPSTGTFTVGSLYVASKIFGGNEQFVKLHAEHSRYYPIKKFRDTVYSVSGRLGLGSPFGGRQTLPVSERFFAGGARDLRGFGFEEAGPRDPVPTFDQNGDPVLDPNGNPVTTLQPSGGNAVIVINNELRFPIYGILGGTVFSDTGNVFRRVKDFRPQDLTQTVGFGFRLKTPIGPVRLDLAFLVFNKPAGQPTFRRHISFGSTF
jgi:outer membrane protein insertion porin family